MKTDIKKLEDDLKRVYLKLGKPPSREEYLIHGEYGVNTIRRAWDGSWNKALLEIIGEVNVKKLEPLKNISCKYCKKEFMPNQREQIYCSVSCVNRDKPKRQRTKKCKTCDNLIRSGFTYCANCIKERIEKVGNTPLSHFMKKHKDANRFCQVRKHAKKIMENDPQICSCGYNKHVEVCHRKDIKDFLPETLVKEVNRKDNLILLCPNCHWEFDHNKKMVGRVGFEPTGGLSPREIMSLLH